MNFVNRLFGGTKTLGRGQRVVLMGLPHSGPLAHPNYRTLSKETYERNVVVFSCVSQIAKAAASVPWMLQQEQPHGVLPKRIMSTATARKSFMYYGTGAYSVKKALQTTQVTDHPLLQLLEQPNDQQAQADYIMQLISYWLLSGNTYEEFIKPMTRPDGDPLAKQPLMMFNLRPDRMEIVPGDPRGDSYVGVYTYTYAGKRSAFDPRSILHRKFFNPTNDFYGMSPLQAAVMSWQTDNIAADWNHSLLKNEGRPSGALITPTSLGDTEFERAKQEIKESYSGSNVGTPMLLEGGLKWEPLGLSPQEMDWLASRRQFRVELCSIFHMPPELIGDNEHKTYNSFPEARRAFWMEAVLPLMDAIRDSYNQRLVPLFGDERLFIDYDRDQIDALREDQEKVWTRVEKNTSLTTNEKRIAIGFDPWSGDTEVDPVEDVPVGLLPNTTVRMTSQTVPPNEDNGPAPPVVVPPKTDPQKKSQDLTPAQQAAQLRLKRGLSRIYREEGSALARHLLSVLGQLVR